MQDTEGVLQWGQVTGFVPQDDILLPLLTVEESLLFSARRRLPASYTSDQHVSHVEHALQVIGCRNSHLAEQFDTTVFSRHGGGAGSRACRIQGYISMGTFVIYS